MNIIPARLCVIVAFCHLSGAISYAQNCSCEPYEVIKTEQGKSNAASRTYREQLLSYANPICKAKSYEWAASDYIDEQNLDTAEGFLQKAEKILKQTGCGDSIFLTTYKLWAQIYYIRGDFGKAQEYSFKLLRAAESAGNAYETAVCYTMIAQLFNQTGQAGKGIIYSRMAIPLIRKIDVHSKRADILFKLSKRYLWHYQDTKNRTSLDSSELFNLEQLTIVKKINRTTAIAAGFSNLQGIAYERKDYKKALQYLDSSFAYTSPEDIANLGVNYFDKADLLIEINELESAATMADSALFYYRKSGGVPYIAETYSLISRIAQLKGDYKKAFETKEASRNITDSIRNVEKAKQVTELERKYTQAKNEKTIKELAQQKRIYLLLAIGGLLLLTVLVFFIRQQSLKNKQKILETEQRLNRARMNPHFFFNALSSLQSFALEGNDGKSIATNLSRFSHIMRETLESTYKEYVTIEQELDFLEEYMGLQKIRFPQKFSYEISFAENMEPNELIIPSMILQPFVENSIEHGFGGIDYPGKVSIRFDVTGKDLHIAVSDNGKGLATVAKENNGHISRASQIIRDRIYLLNIKLKTRASFSVENRNGGEKGVLVKVTLPVLYKEDVAG